MWMGGYETDRQKDRRAEGQTLHEEIITASIIITLILKIN